MGGGCQEERGGTPPQPRGMKLSKAWGRLPVSVLNPVAHPGELDPDRLSSSLKDAPEEERVERGGRPQEGGSWGPQHQALDSLSLHGMV